MAFRLLLLYRVVALNTYRFLIGKISKDDVVVDACANIGIFTILAAKMARRVVAFEPDPDNLVALKRNVELNKLSNVTIFEKILYKDSGSLLHFQSNGAMSKISEEGGIEVESIILDEATSHVSENPTILKMDIEGAEKSALYGMSESLKTIRHIDAEIHSSEDYRVFKTIVKDRLCCETSIEDLSTVWKYSLRHPIKIARLEFGNNCRTLGRVLFASRTSAERKDESIMIFC